MPKPKLDVLAHLMTRQVEMAAVPNRVISKRPGNEGDNGMTGATHVPQPQQTYVECDAGFAATEHQYRRREGPRLQGLTRSIGEPIAKMLLVNPPTALRLP
jgi:hypothetical protein